MKPALNLGAWRHLNGTEGGHALWLPAEHLVTHGVVVGMTGSGKTGLVTVMIEEAARAKVPTLVIDVKGDLPNLLLAALAEQLRRSRSRALARDGSATASSAEQIATRAAELAEQRRSALAEWQIGEPELAAYAAATRVRVLTPGGTAGEPLHMLSSLERRSPRWDSIRKPRATRSRQRFRWCTAAHWGASPTQPRAGSDVLLASVLAERRLAAGQTAELGALMQDVLEPPIDEIGALSVNAFMKKTERKSLAAALNSLLAAPSFASWRQGTTLDGRRLAGVEGGADADCGRGSVAHLDDEERALVLGVLLEEVLSWVRTLQDDRKSCARSSCSTKCMASCRRIPPIRRRSDRSWR